MEIPKLKKFSSPEEEIAYLRTEVAKRERALLERNKNIDATDHETISTMLMK